LIENSARLDLSNMTLSPLNSLNISIAMAMSSPLTLPNHLLPPVLIFPDHPTFLILSQSINRFFCSLSLILTSHLRRRRAL
jgi:hypothetical protein